MKTIALALVIMGGLIVASCPVVAETHTTTLNGLEIGVDKATGSIVRLACAPTGVMLQAQPGSAGVLDLAYPIPQFVPLRLASRYSGARILSEPKALTIIWDKLGPSRDSLQMPEGNVSAQVKIMAADDGRSVVMTCKIENKSKAQISQVLFPDLQGLKSFEGPEHTRLTLARQTVYPFMEPFQAPDSTPFYPHRTGWKQYAPGGYAYPNSLRWLDFGGLKGGLSVFQKRWGDGEKPSVLTNRRESDPWSLRLCWQYKTPIKPGESWQSDEIWLTPHGGGWAKGIEVYRDYVTKANPPRELPRHVRDGLGFRSGWMIQPTEPDAAQAAFRYADIPRLAADAKLHGLQEMVLWGLCQYFVMPMPIREELGTRSDLLDGIRAASQAGVNVAPFVSIQWAINESAERYGAKPSADAYVYHPELIPNSAAYYLSSRHPVQFWKAAKIRSDNLDWQKDAFAALREWMGWGIHSFCYDVFEPIAAAGSKPPLVAFAEQIRRECRAINPQSTFSGESISSGNLEYESPLLDYTWNWLDHTEAAPILNVLRHPRLNCNVESSPRAARKGFCEGLYLNAMPRKPDQANGTALISEERELSAALKELAKLRKQFLDFFVRGTALGDSVLTKPCQAFVRSHQLKDRLLVFVLNDNEEPQSIEAQSDLSLWLPSSDEYHVTQYDIRGEVSGRKSSKGPRVTLNTGKLPRDGFTIFEITVR